MKKREERRRRRKRRKRRRRKRRRGSNTAKDEAVLVGKENAEDARLEGPREIS